VEKHGEMDRVRFRVGHRRGDLNGMRSASRGEEGPRKRSRCHILAFRRSEGGPGFGRWSEKPICVSDEGTDASPARRLRQTVILVGRCSATTTDSDFRPERDPARRLRLWRRTCACRPLIWMVSFVSKVGNAGKSLPLSV